MKPKGMFEIKSLFRLIAAVFSSDVHQSSQPDALLLHTTDSETILDNSTPSNVWPTLYRLLANIACDRSSGEAYTEQVKALREPSYALTWESERDIRVSYQFLV